MPAYFLSNDHAHDTVHLNSSKLCDTLQAYETPSHTKVDHVGLPPDVACQPDVVGFDLWQAGGLDDGAALLDDPCITLAAGKLKSMLEASPS